MDTLSKKQRTKTMKAIKSKDSGIELELRKALWKKGYRYRKNYKHLLGKPDIVFTSKKIAIFCDSDFWHGFNWEERKFDIKSNREYWWPKIERNIERDIEVNRELEKNGWIVLRFWGHEIKKFLNSCIKKIESEYEV